MNVFSALALMAILYIVLPVGVCAAMLVMLGGAERFLPKSMESRATAQRDHTPGSH